MLEEEVERRKQEVQKLLSNDEILDKNFDEKTIEESSNTLITACEDENYVTKVKVGKIKIENENDIKSHIDKIRAGWINLNSRFRNLFAKIIKNLGPTQYTTVTSFLSELFQNCDDTEYHDEDKALLKIILDKDFLIVSSNEK